MLYLEGIIFDCNR